LVWGAFLRRQALHRRLLPGCRINALRIKAGRMNAWRIGVQGRSRLNHKAAGMRGQHPRDFSAGGELERMEDVAVAGVEQFESQHEVPGSAAGTSRSQLDPGRRRVDLIDEKSLRREEYQALLLHPEGANWAIESLEGVSLFDVGLPAYRRRGMGERPA